MHLDTETHGADTTWLAVAQKARDEARAHARANKEALLETLPGGHFMTDEELAAYEAEEEDSEEEEEAPPPAKSNKRKKMKTPPPPASKPAKAGAAPRTAARNERQHTREEDEEDAFQHRCAQMTDSASHAVSVSRSHSHACSLFLSPPPKKVKAKSSRENGTADGAAIGAATKLSSFQASISTALKAKLLTRGEAQATLLRYLRVPEDAAQLTSAAAALCCDESVPLCKERALLDLLKQDAFGGGWRAVADLPVGSPGELIEDQAGAMDQQ